MSSSHNMRKNKIQNIQFKNVPIKPERQKRRERRMDSIDDVISINISAVGPLAKCITGDDNKAADRGKKPLSCSTKNIKLESHF